MIENYLTKTSILKEEIQASIANSLKEVDSGYYNPSFNLMEEIINVFGELDFAKVKCDIDNLTKISEQLDKSIKLLVQKHSEEFYQILGYVREMKTMLKDSKEQYSFAEISLDSLIVIISSLISGESQQWKLKSIFFNEVLSKLRKTLFIYELLQNCDSYLVNDKIYETIDLLMSNEDEHQVFDKEFRQFNLLVNVNLRFNKLNSDITNKLIGNLNGILFFDEGNCLKIKVGSLIDYLLSSYAKVSIDMEVTQPLIKFMTIINQTVDYSLKHLASGDTKDNGNAKGNQSSILLEDKQHRNSLVYIIQCLKRYNNPKVLVKYSEDFSHQLIIMMTNILQSFSEDYEVIYKKITQLDLNNKNDKIVFLMFIQIPLLMCYHSLRKFKSITKHTPSCSKEGVIYNSFESIILLPLTIIHRVVCYSYQSLIDSEKSSIDQSNVNANANAKIDVQASIEVETKKQSKESTGNANDNIDLFHLEIIYKRKISEMPFITIDCLPISYKIYYDFYIQCQEQLGITFPIIMSKLNEYSKQLYQYLESKFCPKKFFDINTFIFEYDLDTSNFKFINDITKAMNQLKRLSIFACGDNYINIMKIIKALFIKLYDDTKTFIEKQKKELIHKTLYGNLYGYLITTQPEIVSKVLIDFQYRKYEKKIIKQMPSANSNNNDKVINSNTNSSNKIESISASLTEFVIDIALTTKQPDQLSLMNRNYKLIELLTKFIACTESALIINENFIFDIIKQSMPNVSLDQLLDQVGQIGFESSSKEANIDLRSLILITLTHFDYLSYSLFQILLLLKIEFVSLAIPLMKNISIKNYALKEPEINPEYFVTSFVNDLLMYKSLFQYNLTEVEYAFVKEDYMTIINEIFIDCVQNIDVSHINHYGVNLLMRDYEYIRVKLGNGYGFRNKKFESSIKYFVNYAGLVSLNDEQLKVQLEMYHNVEPFNDTDINQILLIRGNAYNSINTNHKVNKKDDKMTTIVLKGFI